MPRNRVARRSFQRSPGRLTEWFSFAFASAATALPASTGIILTSLSAAGLAKRPFTVTRTVGTLWVMSDQNVAVEFPSGAVGRIVVSEKASTTGFTAVPDPVTEAPSDLWHMYRDWAVEGSASTNVGRPLVRIDFDSRAQRKVADGDDLLTVIANASAAQGVLFYYRARTLVKLS